MAHALETAYGLNAVQLLDAIQARFRLRAALEGAVAEVQMAEQIATVPTVVLQRYEAHDRDGHPDFSLWIAGRQGPILAECKTVRNEVYGSRGQLTAYKVEVQKTRASQGDPTSRLYDADYFDVLGVCLGKQTGDWRQFLFVRTQDLARHSVHPRKLAVMHRVPLPDGQDLRPWYSDLGELIREQYLGR